MTKFSSYEDPGKSMDTTFALYRNLIAFQLTHVSCDAAKQTLTQLFSTFPSHLGKLYVLAAQFHNRTSGPTMALDMLDKVGHSEIGPITAELCVCAVKLVMKQVKLVYTLINYQILTDWYTLFCQGVDSCHDDMLTAALPWLQHCVCWFYNISVEKARTVSLNDTAFLFRLAISMTSS